MKRLFALILAGCLLFVTAAATEVSEDAGLRLVAICDNENIEAGDQFLVRVMLTGDFSKYLTYSVCGSFDFETAELIAPVYKDDGFSIVYNEFNNDDGSFQFDAADIANLSGSSDPLLCSLLFRAKKPGRFSIRFGKAGKTGKEIYIGRTAMVGGKIDYDLNVDGFETEIHDDSDGDDVIIIAERKAKTPFTDMDGYAWAEVAVGAMSRLGVLDSIAEPGGRFEPSKSVTRGEFVAMLARGTGLGAGTSGFDDVPDDYPFAAEIKAARRAGVALGDENGNFNPDATVTRQDISAFVYRALDYLNKIRPADASYLDSFPDKADVSDYAVAPLSAVVRSRLIKGDDAGRLNPKKEMTRAEAAVLMESVIIHIKLVR